MDVDCEAAIAQIVKAYAAAVFAVFGHSPEENGDLRRAAVENPLGAAGSMR
jgi:hypothetical protein